VDFSYLQPRRARHCNVADLIGEKLQKGRENCFNPFTALPLIVLQLQLFVHFSLEIDLCGILDDDTIKLQNRSQGHILEGNPDD
jgi:hypothetical protein